MSSNYIYELSSHPDVILHHANRYIEFIQSCVHDNSYTEKHHILPASIFNEFKNLYKHKWNCAVLTARQHFIAHCMLARAFNRGSSASRSMILAFNMMCSNHNQRTQSRYVNSRLYEQNRKHVSETMRDIQLKETNPHRGSVWVTSPCLHHRRKVSGLLINEYYEQGWYISRSKQPYKNVKPIKPVIFGPPKPRTNRQKSNKLHECKYCGELFHKECNPWCVEYRKSITAYKTPIVDDLGNIFNSMTDAARYYSTDVENIRLQVTRGIYHKVNKRDWWYHD